jgi:hypothetical protein
MHEVEPKELVAARADLLMNRTCPNITNTEELAKFLKSKDQWDGEYEFLVRSAHDVRPDLRKIAARHKEMFNKE